jgi:hypothetical protein
MRRFLPAAAAVLGLVLTSGCTILPIDKTDIGVVIDIRAVHDAVVAAATTAPASAESAYNDLRRDFNGYISARQEDVGSYGTTMKKYDYVDLSMYPLAGQPAIQKDLEAFAAAAPTAPSGAVFASSTHVTDELVTVIFPEVSAIKNSRLDQAATFNRELEKLKLPEWSALSRPGR